MAGKWHGTAHTKLAVSSTGEQPYRALADHQRPLLPIAGGVICKNGQVPMSLINYHNAIITLAIYIYTMKQRADQPAPIDAFPNALDRGLNDGGNSFRLPISASFLNILFGDTVFGHPSVA
jgi:hypothetical protein